MFAKCSEQTLTKRPTPCHLHWTITRNGRYPSRRITSRGNTLERDIQRARFLITQNGERATLFPPIVINEHTTTCISRQRQAIYGNISQRVVGTWTGVGNHIDEKGIGPTANWTHARHGILQGVSALNEATVETKLGDRHMARDGSREGKICVAIHGHRYRRSSSRAVWTCSRTRRGTRCPTFPFNMLRLCTPGMGRRSARGSAYSQKTPMRQSYRGSSTPCGHDNSYDGNE